MAHRRACEGPVSAAGVWLEYAAIHPLEDLRPIIDESRKR